MHATTPSGLQLTVDDLPGRDFVVGLSGGLDSIVLLHLLAASTGERGLRAIHVHHGLHADADRWAAHCARTCKALGLGLQVVRVAIPNGRGDGREAAARKARHAAFETALGDDEVLVLAHHRDDQAETFLLRALRGSGVDGLATMRAWRSYGRGWLWRPLLRIPRSQLLSYAQQHDLHWIDDPSNADTTLDRNFLRHQVLPLLRERWPQADAAFARSAGLCAQAADLLDDEDTQALATARTDDPQSLDCAALMRWPAARRARVLRRWIAELGLPPLPAQGVEQVECDLLDVASDRQPRFDWAGATIRRWRKLLHADLLREPLSTDWQVQWSGCAPLELPCGGTLNLEYVAPTNAAKYNPLSPNAKTVRREGTIQLLSNGFGRSLTVHARQGGERIVLPGRRHSHALKHVLQELQVPPWLRERLPLLSDADGRVLAAGDLVASADFDAWLRERDARLTWSTAGTT